MAKRKKEWPNGVNSGAQEGMTEGRPGAAILTGSATGRSVVPLQLRPPGLVVSSVSCQGRFDAGKSDPVVGFGEKCTGRGGLVCGRGEREQREEAAGSGPRRRGLRTQRKHGELTAFWGNTKLRSEATSKAPGRGILVGVVGRRWSHRRGCETRCPGLAQNATMSVFKQQLVVGIARSEADGEKGQKKSNKREEKEDKAAGAKGRSRGWILHAQLRLAD